MMLCGLALVTRGAITFLSGLFLSCKTLFLTVGLRMLVDGGFPWPSPDGVFDGGLVTEVAGILGTLIDIDIGLPERSIVPTD